MHNGAWPPDVPGMLPRAHIMQYHCMVPLCSRKHPMDAACISYDVQTVVTGPVVAH